MAHIAKMAAARIREFAEVADRLATKGVVVTELKSGSEFWEIQVQNETDIAEFIERLRGPEGFPQSGPDVTRAFWDGRDKFLTIERSPTRALSAPNQWKAIESKRVFDNPETELLPYVEQFLAEEMGSS